MKRIIRLLCCAAVVSTLVLGACTESSADDERTEQGVRIGSGEGQYASWEEVPFEEYALTFEGVAPAADGTLRLTVKGVDVGSTAVEGHISALCLAPAE